MFVEIGHFYANDPNYNLDYLKDQTFRSDDELCVFIDDYSNEKDVLNRGKLVCALKAITNNDWLHVVRESSMVEFYHEALRYLDKSKLEDYSHNGVSTELYYDGRKIYDYVTKRPTCQMLSYIWTMYRIGAFKSSLMSRWNDSLLVIDQKYANLEDRVFKMVPKELRKHLFYRFYKP